MDKVPETFKEPVISVDPVIENFPLSVTIRDKLPLSSTTNSVKNAPADPLNIKDPLAGSILMSLLYIGTGYKYFIVRFVI